MHVASSRLMVSVVSLSKALYHNHSSRLRCVNGYRQCWEGYRLVVGICSEPHTMEKYIVVPEPLVSPAVVICG